MINNIMIIFLYTFINLIFLIISKTKKKSGLNVVGLITFLWSVFPILAAFNIYGLKSPRLEIHFFVMTFLTIFNLINIQSKTPRKLSTDIKLNKTVSIKILLVFILAIVMLSPYLFLGLKMFLENFDLLSVRKNVFYNSELNQGYYFSFFFKTLPIIILNALVIIINFNVMNKRIKGIFMNLSIISMILIVFLSSGRYIFITFLISILFSVDIKLSKFNRKSKMFIIFALLLLLIITLSRSESVLRSIVIYYSGSFSFFEYILSNPSTFNVDSNLYGQATFGFIIEPIMLLFKFLGFTAAKVPSYYFNTTIQNFYNIGSEQKIMFNNNTTLLYYFYRDFNYIGIIIGAIFYSIMFRLSRNGYYKGNLKLSYTYIYLIIIFLNGIMTGTNLVGAEPLITILLFNYISVKKSRRILNHGYGIKYTGKRNYSCI